MLLQGREILSSRGTTFVRIALTDNTSSSAQGINLEYFDAATGIPVATLY